MPPDGFSPEVELESGPGYFHGGESLVELIACSPLDFISAEEALRGGNKARIERDTPGHAGVGFNGHKQIEANILQLTYQ